MAEPIACWKDGCYLAVTSDRGECEVHGPPPVDTPLPTKEKTPMTPKEAREQIVKMLIDVRKNATIVAARIAKEHGPRTKEQEQREDEAILFLIASIKSDATFVDMLYGQHLGAKVILERIESNRARQEQLRANLPRPKLLSSSK